MRTQTKFDIYSHFKQQRANYIIEEMQQCFSLQSLQDSFTASTGLASVICECEGGFITHPSLPAPRPELYSSAVSERKTATPATSTNAVILSETNKLQKVPIHVDGLHVADWVIDFSLTHTGLDGHDEHTPQLDLVGNLVKMIGNITEDRLKLHEKEKFNRDILNRLATTEKRYEGLINSCSEAVIIYNTNHEIVALNKKAEELYQINAESAIGLNINCVKMKLIDENMHEIAAEEYSVNKILRTGQSIKNRIVGYKHPNSDQITWVKLNGMPIINFDGAIEEVIITFEDISLLKQKTDTIVQSIRTLENVQELALLGTYTSNLTEQKWCGSNLYNKIMGIQPNDLLTQKAWLNLIHPDWRATMIEQVNQKLEKDNAEYNNIYKIIQPISGNERWIRDIGKIILDPQTRSKIAVGTVQDITDLKTAEEQALLSEDKYRRIFENVQDVYYKINNQYIIEELSPSVRYLTHVPVRHIIGQKATDFLVQQEALKKMEDIMEHKGDLKDFHVTLINHTQQEIHVSLSSHMIRDSYGNITHYEGFVRDISYRKKMEKQLKESENRLRSYIECAPTMIAISDPERNILDINPACMKLTGFSKQEIIEHGFDGVFAPETHEKLEPHLQRIILHGRSSEEFIILCKDQSKRTIQFDSTLLPNGQIVSFGIDISYRKKMEDTLLQHKQILEEAQQTAGLGHAIINFTDNTWESSPVFDKLTGIDHTFEKHNRNWVQLIHPDDMEDIRLYFRTKVISTNTQIDREVRIIRPRDGEVRWFKSVGRMIYSESGQRQYLRITIQDITEQRNWTEVLHASESLYRTTLNASPDVIVVVDLHQKIKIASNSALNLFGYENVEEIRGHSILNFLAPEDRKKARLRLGDLRRKGMGTQEYKMQKKDGEIFEAELNGDIVRNDRNLPTGMVLILRDITQRKKVEQRLIESEKQLKSIALRLQRVREEEKTALAREIHDDMGQILVAMKIELGLLKNKMAKNKTSEQTELIQDKLTELLDLTNKTIQAARRIMDELRTDELEVIGLIETAKKLTQNFEKRYEVLITFNCPSEALQLQKSQSIALYRILQEALSNISKYANATEVAVEFEIVQHNLRMTIVDNGCGFDLQQRHRNNAYGLRGIRERILLLEGEADIQSQPGKGTSVSVRIPYRQPAESEIPKETVN